MTKIKIEEIEKIFMRRKHNNAYAVSLLDIADNVYRIKVVDGINGIKTICGRIISFTMYPERDILSYDVDKNTKPSVIDTITIDCSEDGESNICTINVCDIRFIEMCAGFEDISQTKPIHK